MPKPKSVTILSCKWGTVISVRDHNGEEYRMDYWALQHVLKQLVDIDWFKEKKVKWKYKRLDFEETYKNFIRDEISQIVGADDKIVFQKWPSFRVHLPGNVAVGGWHRDFDYNHPEGEINFILAITPMFESNATISESEPGKMDFRQFTINPGQIVKFNGNKCIHGNLPNTTGKTRVSLDFRVMKYENYNNRHLLTSLSKNNKFLIGDYYDIIT